MSALLGRLGVEPPAAEAPDPMGPIIVLAFTAAFYPTLLAATTVMLLLPNPQRLLVGYWMGAMLTSVTLGLLIVFKLEGSSIVSTTQRSLSPGADLVLGALALILARVLASGGAGRRIRRPRTSSQPKGPPQWMQALQKGSARTTFVIGALLTLPGVSYLAALNRISKLDYSTAETTLVVIGFNLVMLILLEGPLIAFAVAPERTPVAIERAKQWAGRNGTKYAARGLAVIGALLVIKGVIELLS